MTRLIFLDIESTGLNPEIHDVWEIAAIVRDHDGSGDTEYSWMVRPDLTHADPQALRIGRFYERFYGDHTADQPDHVGYGWIEVNPDPELQGEEWSSQKIAQRVAEYLADAVVIGSNPAFDERFLTRWLRRNGQVWSAHYRTIDVTTLGWGYIIGGHVDYDNAAYVPPRTHAVSTLLGIDPAAYDRHTALGDARMVRDLYDAITGGAR